MKALGKGTASAVPPERPNDAALAAVVPCFSPQHFYSL